MMPERLVNPKLLRLPRVKEIVALSRTKHLSPNFPWRFSETDTPRRPSCCMARERRPRLGPSEGRRRLRTIGAGELKVAAQGLIYTCRELAEALDANRKGIIE
jgi:hypothetical protein